MQHDLTARTIAMHVRQNMRISSMDLSLFPSFFFSLSGSRYCDVACPVRRGRSDIREVCFTVVGFSETWKIQGEKT